MRWPTFQRARQKRSRWTASFRAWRNAGSKLAKHRSDGRCRRLRRRPRQTWLGPGRKGKWQFASDRTPAPSPSGHHAQKLRRVGGCLMPLKAPCPTLPSGQRTSKARAGLRMDQTSQHGAGKYAREAFHYFTWFAKQNPREPRTCKGWLGKGKAYKRMNEPMEADNGADQLPTKAIVPLQAKFWSLER